MNLEEIRQQYREQVEKTLICPVCEHGLTVDKTEFFETHLCENCFEYSKIIELYTGNICCAFPKIIHVGYVIANDAIQVRTQCTRCSEMSGKSVGGFSKEQREALPKANIERRDKRREWLREKRNAFCLRAIEGRQRIFEEKKAEWFEDYNEYLRSDIWKQKRLLVLKRDNYTCQSCLSGRAIQVHHKSYEFVDLCGSEPAFDLVSICIKCHNRIEELKRQKRQSK